MSITILSGDFTVYFTNDTGGDKQIAWTGSATGTRTVNELYSALQDLFDNNTAGAGDYMDEGIPMSASTPTQYSIGEIETNDNEPWFIDPETIEHLTGGALETSGWTRSPLVGDGTGTIGIVRFTYTAGGTAPSSADVGETITMTTDGDTGIVLYVDTANLQIWIRPTDNTAGNSFDNAPTSNGAFTITTTGASGTQTAAATTGELVWSNPFTIGNIVDNTRIYIYQSFDEIANFWGDGHIDRLILTSDGFASGLIDLGNLTFFARQYGTLYDFSIASFTNGGRAPVALSTSDDTNNDSGTRSLTVSGVTGTFNADNYIYVGASFATATKKAKLTNVSGTTLTYYLLGDLTDFANTDSITEWTGSANDATATVSGSTSAAGPAALATSPTITFGATSQDIGDGAGNQPYDVLINVQGNTLADFYEYTKYITRRQGTNDIDGGTQTIEGESYLGTGDLFIPYDTASNDPPFTQGEIITGPSNFSGRVTAVHDTGVNVGFLTVRDTRGTTPADNATLTGQTSGHTVLVNTTTNSIETYTQLRNAPFGTFAGGQFFGARGVWITNMDSNDANSYTLIDSYGVTHNPPATYPISITANDASNNAIQGAQVFIRKSGSYYDYTSHATNNAAGDSTFEVNETVDTDLPQTGWLHVFVDDDNTKQNYRYASWSGLVFTLLSEITGSATSTGSSTSLISTTTNFLTADIEEGDTIRNTTDGSWAVVDEIVDADNITTTALIGGADNTWSSGDAFSLHRLAITYDSTDQVDVPIVNAQTNASGVVSATYAGTVPISIVVRIRSNEGGTKFVPYSTTGTLSSSGFSLTAVLVTDTVAT